MTCERDRALFRNARLSPSSAANSTGLIDLINGYMALEAACDELIEQQERQHRRAWADSRGVQESTLIEPGSRSVGVQVQAKQPCSFKPDAKSLFGLPLQHASRELISMSRRIVPEGHLARRLRFLHEISPGQLEELRRLELDIRGLREDLDRLEERILEQVPMTPHEAMKKMRFLVCLLLDQREIEVDYFAYIVDECITIIAASLTEPAMVFGERLEAATEISSHFHGPDPS